MNRCAKMEGKWIFSKNTDKSLDECRRVTRRVQTNVDEYNESKIFFFNS